MPTDRGTPKTLNIKHPQVHRLARELADETGESMTEAVVESLRERLGRVRAARGDAVEVRLERMLELAAVMRERAPDGYFGQDFDVLLYDEAGLPQVIVDTSAIVAILSGEPDGPVYARLIAEATEARISAATYVELGIVVDGRQDPVLSSALDRFLADAGLRVEALTAEQAQIARDAYRRFGRTSGSPARLNMGDCFAYALARDLGEPLLFKGNEFKATDIELVIEPVPHKRLSEVVASYAAIDR